jgi:hypothetical protein
MGKEVVSKGILSMITEKRYPNNSQKPHSKPYDYREETKTHFTSSLKTPLLWDTIHFFIYHHVQNVINPKPATINNTIPTE